MEELIQSLIVAPFLAWLAWKQSRVTSASDANSATTEAYIIAIEKSTVSQTTSNEISKEVAGALGDMSVELGRLSDKIGTLIDSTDPLKEYAVDLNTTNERLTGIDSSIKDIHTRIDRVLPHG